MMRTLDGKTFMSLPQREELAREENQFFAAKNNSTENQFFTHKTNSSSGGDSIHSELMTPPSDSHFSPDKSKSSSGSGITKLSGGSGSGGGSYIPNWSDLFPPPQPTLPATRSPWPTLQGCRETPLIWPRCRQWAAEAAETILYSQRAW